MKIDSNYFWIVTGFMTMGTLAIRFSVIGMAHRLTISPRLREVFTYIPAAIYPALIMPQVFLHQGHVAWLAGKERLFVLILAIGVSFALRNMLVSVVFGLTALYLLT